MKAMKQELEWVRQNPKGRQAKSKARIARFEELSSHEYQKRNETQEIFIPVADRLGNQVIDHAVAQRISPLRAVQGEAQHGTVANALHCAVTHRRTASPAYRWTYSRRYGHYPVQLSKERPGATDGRGAGAADSSPQGGRTGRLPPA